MLSFFYNHIFCETLGIREMYIKEVTMIPNDYEMILNSLYEGVYIVDRQRKILFWNQGAKNITGYSAEEAIGKFCHDNILNHIDVYGRQLCLDGCPLHETLIDGKARELDAYLQHKRGHRVPVHLKSIPMYESGEITATIEIFTESTETENEHFKTELSKHELLRDPLTGLPNKRFFDHYINSKMNDFRTLDIPFAVAIVDIDNFDGINKTYGVSISDEILILLSESYRSAIRLADLIGRWTNDEFVFVFSGVTNESLNALCEKIRIMSEASTLRANTIREVEIGVSVGASVVRKDDTADKLIRRVSERLKKAKTKGGNCCITR